MNTDYPTCEKLLHPPRRQWPLRAGVAVGMVGTLAATGGGLLGAAYMVRQNERKFDAISETALSLASDRNTCSIRALKVISSIGKPVVEITIDVTPKTEPSSMDNKYDGFGMNVTFRDNTETDLSGIRVIRKVPGVEPDIDKLDSRHGDVPDTRTNSMTLSEPVLIKDHATYEVYRQNSVDTLITGPLVTDASHKIMNLVSCGTFEYQAGSPPKVH